jgi:lactobin A/cerein 7B family class IIb bacteriocin
MNVQETTEIRELTSEELNDVNGGFLLAAAAVFVGSAALGYAIRRGMEAAREWVANG